MKRSAGGDLKSLRTVVVWLLVATPVVFLAGHLLARALPQYDANGYSRMYWFPAQFPIFLMGVAGYFVWKRSSKDNKIASLALLVLAAAGYAILLPFDWRNLYQVGLVCLMLLLSLAFHPWQVLVNPLTRFLGRISYSVYLLHFFPCLYLHRLNASFPVIVGGTLAATIPVAYLAWKYVEEPGIAMGRRLIKHLEARWLPKMECLKVET